MLIRLSVGITPFLGHKAEMNISNFQKSSVAPSTVSATKIMSHATNSELFSNHYSTNSKLSDFLPQQKSTFVLSPSSTSLLSSYKGVTSRSMQVGFSSIQLQLPFSGSVSVQDSTSTSYGTPDLTSTRYSPRSLWPTEHSTSDASSAQYFRSQYLSSPWSSTSTPTSTFLSRFLPQQISTPVLSPSSTSSSFLYKGVTSSGIQAGFSFTQPPSFSSESLSVRDLTTTAYWTRDLTSAQYSPSSVWSIEYFKSSTGSSSFSLMSGLMGGINSFYLSIGQSANTKISLSSWSGTIPVENSSISPPSHMIISMLKPTLSCKFYYNCYGFVCFSGII